MRCNARRVRVCAEACGGEDVCSSPACHYLQELHTSTYAKHLATCPKRKLSEGATSSPSCFLPPPLEAHAQRLSQFTTLRIQRVQQDLDARSRAPLPHGPMPATLSKKPAVEVQGKEAVFTLPRHDDGDLESILSGASSAVSEAE